MQTDVTEDMNMANGTDPSMLTAEQRLAEVAMLLALAMVRLWAKQRRKRAFSPDNSLGFARKTRPPVTAG